MRILVASGLLALAACAPSAEQSNADLLADNLEQQADNMEAMADRALASANSAIADASTGSGWTYDEKKDEMRGSTRKLASVSATNSINLAFPYGETTPSLVIRKDPKYGFNIYVSSEGQLLCREYNNDTISVKFDNGPIREWSCTGADSGSSDVIFFDNEQRLLSAIKGAKKMIVEINYYDNGRQQMTFPVTGLKW